MSAIPPKCPICRKAAEDKFKPFCSKRCQMLDLSRWLGEGYKVVGSDVPDDEPASPQEASDTEIE